MLLPHRNTKFCHLKSPEWNIEWKRVEHSQIFQSLKISRRSLMGLRHDSRVDIFSWKKKTKLTKPVHMHMRKERSRSRHTRGLCLAFSHTHFTTLSPTSRKRNEWKMSRRPTKTGLQRMCKRDEELRFFFSRTKSKVELNESESTTHYMQLSATFILVYASCVNAFFVDRWILPKSIHTLRALVKLKRFYLTLKLQLFEL